MEALCDIIIISLWRDIYARMTVKILIILSAKIIGTVCEGSPPPPSQMAGATAQVSPC